MGGSSTRPDRADPACPICGAPKKEHTPEQAQRCFEKVRGRQAGY